MTSPKDKKAEFTDDDLKALYGSVPDLTGDLSTQEYIDMIRGREPADAKPEREATPESAEAEPMNYDKFANECIMDLISLGLSENAALRLKNMLRGWLEIVARDAEARGEARALEEAARICDKAPNRWDGYDIAKLIRARAARDLLTTTNSPQISSKRHGGREDG
jgi:hypothetical protein